MMVPLTLHPAALREGTQRAVGENPRKENHIPPWYSGPCCLSSILCRHLNPRRHLLKFPGSGVSKQDQTWDTWIVIETETVY